MPTASSTASGHYLREYCSLFIPSHQVFLHIDKDPLNFLFSKLNNPSSLRLCSHEIQYSPLSVFMSRIFDALSANLPLKISEYKRTGKLCFSWDGDTSSDWAKEIKSNYRISKTRHCVFLSSFSSFNSSFCFPQDFSNNFRLEFCFSNKFNSRTVQNKAFNFKTKIKSLQNHYRKQSWWQIHTTSCSSLSPVSLIIISISWFSPSTLFRNRDPVDLVIGITGTRALFGTGAWRARDRKQHRFI